MLYFFTDKGQSRPREPDFCLSPHQYVFLKSVPTEAKAVFYLEGGPCQMIFNFLISVKD